MPTTTLPAGTDLASRKAHWLALQEPGAPGGFAFIIRLPDEVLGLDLPPYVDPHPHLVKERIAHHAGQYEAGLARMALFEDDRVPFAQARTGTEIWAEAFGCEVHRPDGQMPFAQPFVHSAADVAKVVPPRLEDSTLWPLFDFADELRRRCGDDAVLAPVDVQSPMDSVALIWDKTDLFIAMLDDPAPVRELAVKVRDLMCAFFDEWFARYGTGYVAHYPDYYTEGGITLSEDEIGAVGPEMFDRFFRDELLHLKERYGGLGIHCCADARHHWENLKSLEPKVINLVKPHHRRQDYVDDAIAHFADGPLQMPGGWAHEGEPWEWLDRVPAAARVVLEVPVATVDEGKRACDRLNAIRFG